MGRILSIISAPALVLAALMLSATDAEAIPAFARKYKLGCNTCHTLYPQLNRFGRDFRDNGFRTPDEIQDLLRAKPKTAVPPAASSKGGPALAVSHGSTADAQDQSAGSEDFWSFIPDEIPFSIQAKLHYLIVPEGDVKSDFQLEELQLQTGGTFTPRVSYYLHHHLAEEGEPGDLYAGWVRFNNLFRSNWLNVIVGQTELPLSFSPEIERLSSFEYLVFDRELGANPFNLNRPQLGIQVFGQSERGTKFWAGVANGFGLAVNEETETFDNNSFKDLYARVGQELGEHFLGGYVYYGRARGSTESLGRFSDNFMRVGGDAFINVNKLIVYGTALYARDDNPLGLGEARTFYGGFIEGDVYLSDRAVVLLRFDGVHQELPAHFEEEEETSEEEEEGEEPLFRVNTLAFTPGLQYLLRPNVKLGFEYQIRQARSEDRAIAQLHVSF